MPFCASCGREHPTDARFCPGCGQGLAGTQLSAVTPIATTPTVEPQPSVFASDPTPAAGVPPITPPGSQYIGQWNWGAAFLYPYWLMTHRKPLLGIVWFIVQFIPGVDLIGIGLFFYYGLNGNRIAVNSGRFSDEQQFVTVQNRWRNWAFGFAVLGILFLATSIANSGNRSMTYQSTTADAPAATDPPTQDSASDSSSNTESVSANGTTIGGLTYTVESVSKSASVESFGEEKDAAGEFIIAHLNISNVGQKGATISSSDFHLKRGGTEYDASNATIDNEFFLEQINPGTSKTGTVIFDVPAGTDPTSYDIEVFGNGAEGSQDSTLIQL